MLMNPLQNQNNPDLMNTYSCFEKSSASPAKASTTNKPPTAKRVIATENMKVHFIESKSTGCVKAL